MQRNFRKAVFVIKLVYVPHFDIYTQEKNLADAIDMAIYSINLMGITFENENKQINAL